MLNDLNVFLCFSYFVEFFQSSLWNFLGENESPSMAKRNQMPFTCAFIQEVQRYCTVVPLSVTHIAQNNVEIAGYHIPKGTKV